MKLSQAGDVGDVIELLEGGDEEGRSVFEQKAGFVLKFSPIGALHFDASCARRQAPRPPETTGPEERAKGVGRSDFCGLHLQRDVSAGLFYQIPVRTYLCQLIASKEGDDERHRDKKNKETIHERLVCSTKITTFPFQNTIPSHHRKHDQRCSITPPDLPFTALLE